MTVKLGFGRNNPFPFRFGGGESRVGVERQALIDAFAKGYDVQDDHEKAAEAEAYAGALAIGWACNERLANQAQPRKMLEELTTWEEACSLRPTAADTDRDRRLRVAARMRGISENDLQAIAEAAEELLGSAYVATTVVDPTDEIVFWPGMDPGPPGFEWTSNRAHIRIEVTKSGASSQAEFDALMLQLDDLMNHMLPTWMTYNWHTGSGFYLGVSLLGEAAF